MLVLLQNAQLIVGIMRIKCISQTSSQKCIKQLINPILLFRYCISKTIFVRMTKIESYINRLIHVLLVLEVWLVLKTTPFHQVQGNIVFCNQKNNFKSFKNYLFYWHLLFGLILIVKLIIWRNMVLKISVKWHL